MDHATRSGDADHEPRSAESPRVQAPSAQRSGGFSGCDMRHEIDDQAIAA